MGINMGMKKYLLLFFIIFGLSTIQPAEAQRKSKASSSTTLYWDRPTQYTDGSPLSFSEIAGYTIYMAREPGLYSTFAQAGRRTNKTTIKGLADGTYYFVIKVNLRDGNSSDYSNEVVRVIGNVTQQPTSPASITRNPLTF